MLRALSTGAAAFEQALLGAAFTQNVVGLKKGDGQIGNVFQLLYIFNANSQRFTPLFIDRIGQSLRSKKRECHLLKCFSRVDAEQAIFE